MRLLGVEELTARVSPADHLLHGACGADFFVSGVRIGLKIFAVAFKNVTGPSRQEIDLSRFTAIDDIGANILSRCRKRLPLQGVRQLSDNAAKHLAVHNGELLLSTLQEISALAARSRLK